MSADEKLRAEFEKWALGGANPESENAQEALRKLSNGVYVKDYTQWAWIGYKAFYVNLAAKLKPVVEEMRIFERALKRDGHFGMSELVKEHANTITAILGEKS